MLLGVGSRPLLAQEAERVKPAPRRGFHAPQLALETDGTVLMLWAHPAEKGHDLFVAHRLKGDQLSQPTRVNDQPGSVHFMEFDEFRPALATGKDGRIAVAWPTTDGNVRLAVGNEHGTRFEPSVQLNSRRGSAPAGFVDVAIDRRGQVYATWIDPREAPPRHEEPAQLYYASVDDRGRVTEFDLTSEYTASICGCCRPAVVATEPGPLRFYYRNVDEDGYRDVYELIREPGGIVRRPQRLGPRMWKIEGCPSMGPIHADHVTLWRDGSQGFTRLLASADDTADVVTVAGSDDEWSFSRSPRFVHTLHDGVPPVLAPGTPYGKVFALRDGQWKTLLDETPPWCISMVWIEGQILMSGDEHGELRLEARDVDWN
jgi:hypothetical protein